MSRCNWPTGPAECPICNPGPSDYWDELHEELDKKAHAFKMMVKVDVGQGLPGERDIYYKVCQNDELLVSARADVAAPILRLFLLSQVKPHEEETAAKKEDPFKGAGIQGTQGEARWSGRIHPPHDKV